MASTEGTAGRPIEISDGESESGSSYMGSEESASPLASNTPVCNYRDARFHDRECSRYFDCPTHLVERALSEGDETGDSDIGDGGSGDASSVPSSNTLDVQPGELAAATLPTGLTARGRAATDISPQDEASEESSGDTMDVDTENPTQHGSATSPAIIIQGSSTPGDARPANPVELLRRISGASTLVNQPSSQRAFQTSRELPVAPPPPPPPPHSPERQRSATLFPTTARQAGRSNPAEIVLPRWQPDAEVTYCPICHTQFSIFVRKHHCRYVLRRRCCVGHATRV
jgi:hypothetical protein